MPQYLVVKRAERTDISGYPVVSVVPLQDRAHPLPLLRQFLMTASLQLDLDRLQLSPQSLAHCVSSNDESTPAVRTTDVSLSLIHI